MPKKTTPEIYVVVPDKPMVETSVGSDKIKIIQSIFPATLIYAGQVTGKQYTWVGAGAIVAVDNEDVPYLLSKKIGGKGCCGVQSDGNKLFEQL